MWSVGHHKILSREIQKIILASNFRDIFGSHISGTGGQKHFFPWKMVLSLKMKEIWVSQYAKVLILPDSYSQWLLGFQKYKNKSWNIITKWTRSLIHMLKIRVRVNFSQKGVEKATT